MAKKNDKMPETAKKLAVVTGAAGGVGALLVAELCKAGYRVRAVDRPGVDFVLPSDCDCEKVELDLTQESWPADLMQGADAVFHLAAIVDISLKFRVMAPVNLYATVRMYEAAKQAGVKYFQFYSTAAAYRFQDRPIREDDPLWAPNDYVKTKVMAEDFLKAQVGGPLVNIIRPGLIFGPRGRVLAASYAALLCMLSYVLPAFPNLTGGPRSNYVHAADLAGASLFLYEHPAKHGEAFTVANSDPVGFFDVLRITARAVGMKILPLAIPYPPISIVKLSMLPTKVLPIIEAMNVIDINAYKILCKIKGIGKSPLTPQGDKEALIYGLNDMVLDNGKIRDLGYKFKYPMFEDAWEETIQWYKDNKWLPCK